MEFLIQSCNILNSTFTFEVGDSMSNKYSVIMDIKGSWKWHPESSFIF